MEIEKDEIITNMEIEEPVEEVVYAYRWGTHELYKIIANLMNLLQNCKRLL
jgi:hypothetical protein